MDTDPQLPEDIQSFILQHIDSVPKLEALLLLHQQPSREWDEFLLAKRLYIHSELAAMILEELLRSGLCCLSGRNCRRYRYQPASRELAEVTDRLEALYVRHLIQITRLIHSRQVTRIQHFSDAFKMFKKEDS